MSKKEIMGTGYRKKRDTKITTMLAVFLIFLFSISTTNVILTCSATTSNTTDSTTTEKIVEEWFLDNDHKPLVTKTYYRNSIVHINITILPQSNSSVEIFTLGTYREDFSPTLANITLAPGESFAENYTLIGGVADVLCYLCRCTLDNSNATIQWWYEVLYSARPEGFIGMEFLFIGGAFLLSTMTLVLITKRKSKKKNE